MAITTNQIINKQDIVNYFNENVVNVAFNGINYHSGNVPKYTATATAGTQWSSWANGNASPNNQYTITGGEAIPSNQLSNTAKSELTESQIDSDVITASIIVNAMKQLATNCSRIRNTICRWYHDTSGTDNLVQTITGKSIYLATTPAISGTTRPFYTKNPDTTTMTINSSASQGDVVINNIAKAESMIQFITNLVNEWKTRYNTTVTYTYYTCHSVCHSSCHNRARR